MTMRHTAAVTPKGATTDLRMIRSNDIMFEPEEELSVTQEKIIKSKMGKTSSGYATSVHVDVLHKTNADVMDAIKVRDQIVPQDTGYVKLIKEDKPKKEKKERKVKKPKLRLEHLPCCIENAQLQDDLEAAEVHIRMQDQKIADMQAKSEEKLGFLSAEFQSLKARMSSSLGPEPEQVFSLRVQLEMAQTRAKMETDDLQKQLEAQKAKLVELEASLATAENQVVESKTKLAENWKSHGQAVSKLQQQLADERTAHRLEVKRLNADLQEAKAAAKEQPIRASDQMLENAHQDILKLEEKVLEVCCENLRADKELQTHLKTQADLMEQCNKLHGSASNLVTLFGQPALPELQGQSSKDTSLYVEYLGQLGNSLDAIHQQLRCRVGSK